MVSERCIKNEGYFEPLPIQYLATQKLENVSPKTGLVNQSAINLYSNKFTGPYRCYHLIRVRADVIGLLSVIVGSLSFKVGSYAVLVKAVGCEPVSCSNRGLFYGVIALFAWCRPYF